MLSAAQSDRVYARLEVLAGQVRACLGDALVADPTACVHCAEWGGDTVECQLCGDRKTRIKVFGCALHGRCALAHGVADVRCCGACPDRLAPASAAGASRIGGV